MEYDRLGILVASTNREIDFFLQRNKLNPGCFGRATEWRSLVGLPAGMTIFVINGHRLDADFDKRISDRFKHVRYLEV